MSFLNVKTFINFSENLKIEKISVNSQVDSRRDHELGIVFFTVNYAACSACAKVSQTQYHFHGISRPL